jgi:citronellol/citronellal dehydrogenase
MSDAAYAILNKSSRQLTGQLLLDEPFLRSEGEVEFKHYAVDSTVPLHRDLFVSEGDLEILQEVKDRGGR